MNVAIITGASRGLGLALARELAARDWALVLDARGSAALADVEQELASRTTVAVIAGDITDPAHRRAANQPNPRRLMIEHAGRRAGEHLPPEPLAFEHYELPIG